MSRSRHSQICDERLESTMNDPLLERHPAAVTSRGLSFISYPDEWCAAMLRDAALTILDLTTQLSPRGFSVARAYPRSALFDSSKAIFVDLTSIAVQKNGSMRSAYDEFCRFYYYPLILMSRGQERIARALMPQHNGVLRSEFLNVVRDTGFSRFVPLMLLKTGVSSIRSIFWKESHRPAWTLLKHLRRDLEKVHLPSYQKRDRARKRQSLIAASSDREWTLRTLTLRKILTDLNPSTVLDLSRGPLWTSTVPAMMGFNVVSIDPDSARVSALYQAARDKNLSILPLIIDFMKASRRVAAPDHQAIEATERLKCELVLALGLGPEIDGENQLNSDPLAERLASFSRRWLVVEYDGSKSAKADTPTGCLGSPSAKLREFVGALEKRFSRISTESSDTHSKVLLLCEK